MKPALNYDDLIPKDMRSLVFHFFVVFSRFEYALKRSHFVTKKADPAWDLFAKKHRNEFTSNRSPALTEACEYFENNPPRKQNCKNGILGFDPQKFRNGDPKLYWLLVKVRCVRNNLFHGGKFPLKSGKDPARDFNLIKHALTILDEALLLDKNVKNHFHSPSL